MIVTPGAADERSADIADGFVASFTLGVGQFCTKPGLLFVPAGHKLVDQIVEGPSGVERRGVAVRQDRRRIRKQPG